MITSKAYYINIVYLIKIGVKIMKKIIISSLITVVLFAQSAQDIAEKSFKAISGYGGSEAISLMILKSANGTKNERKLKVIRKEGENGDKSYIEFLYPNDIKGTKLLSFEVIGEDDKQWLYLPALKRIKRISSRNKSGSFVGSEFSYEDISSINYKNYTYPNEAEIVTKDGKNYYKIVRIPIDKHSGYSKQIVWIDTDNYLIRFGEYYNKNGKLLKKISFPKYKKIDNIWRIFEIDIENIQNHKSSKLIWKSEKIHLPINNSDVSKRVLN